jgi:PAS domain S-box-containing protein
MPYFANQAAWIRYGLAVLAVAFAAIAVRYIPIIRETGHGEWIAFFFAVTISIFCCGALSGLLAIGLSLVGVNWLVLPSDWISHPLWAITLNLGFSLLSGIILAISNSQQKLFTALSESRQNLELAQAVGQIGSWRFNEQPNKVYCSAETYRIFGIPEGSAVRYETFLAAVHPEDMAYVAEEGEKALGGQPYDIEHRITVGDEVKWIHGKAVLDFSKDGKLLGGFGIVQDITERKKLELATQTIHERYELVLKGSQGGIWDWDVVTNHVHYSIRWKTLHGYSTDEELYELGVWRDNIHPDDEDRIMAGLELHLAGKTPVFNEEYRIRCKDGTWKWLLDRGIAKRDELGNVIRMAGSEIDITARKVAEMELSNREKELEIIMNLSPNLVAYLSTDFRYLRINKTYEAWWGKEPGQILGREVREIVSERAWRHIQPYMERARSGEAVSFDYHGTVDRWVHVDYVPDIDPSGNVKGIVVNVANITELKLAEQKLLEQENRLSLIMNLMPALISYIDTDFRYIRVNKTYEEWFGVAMKDVIGRTVKEVVGEDIWKIASPYLERARAGEVAGYEENLVYKNNVSRWAKVTFVPDKDEAGTVKGIVVHVADITDLKNAVKAIQEQENALRLIINAMPALIAYIDPNYRYVRANSTYEKWLGIPVERIVGNEVRDIIGEDGWQKIKPFIEKSMAGEEIHCDFLMPYKTGKPRWIHVNYVPDMDASGHVKGIVALVVDVGEIKQAQQEISLLNQRLQHRIDEMQAIFDTAPIGLAISGDLEGKHIQGNRTIEEMMDLPQRSELSFRSIPADTYHVFEAGHELTVDELPMQRAIRGEAVINKFLDIHRHDGRVVTVLCNTKPLVNNDKSIRGAVGTFLDVTQFRAAEIALRESKERLRLAQEAGSLGIFDYNLVSGEMQWDKRLRELWGLAPNTPITFGNCKIGAYPEDLINIEKALDLALDPQGNGEYSVEYRIVRPSDNQTFWIAAFGTVTFADSKPVRLVGFAQDITERKLAEAKLHDTETRLGIAMAELKAGYWDWEFEGNKVFYSTAWKQQLGFEDNELPNRYEEWESRLHPDDKANVLEEIKNYINNLMPNYELEFRLKHKDGTYRWIHSRAVLINDQHEKSVRMVGIHLDITDFRKAKELEQQRKTLEKTSQLYIASQTAAAIAHELNQPLTAASYFADAAVKMLQGGNADSNQLSHALKTCSQQVHRAGKVIPQLLGLLYKGETSIEPFNINRLLNDVRQFIDAEKTFDIFKVMLNLDFDLPAVKANRLQIQKILISLINNGLESMLDSGKSSGTLTVSTRRSADDPNMVEISVCDEGIGVSDDGQLKMIFQPFYTTKKTGIGMGLTICRSLIEAYGGEIWAEKNADAGISVKFTLPLIS